MTEICNDKNCPTHGSISVRGNTFTGVVKSAKPTKTVIIEREIIVKVKKYDRYKKTKSTLYAHNPICINAKENDIVTIGETRKLSKTKSFVVLKKEGSVKEYKEKEEVDLRKRRKDEDEKGEE